MSKHKKKPRALPLLLMLCAGALMVIVFTLLSALQDHPMTWVTRATDEQQACAPQRNATLPDTLKFILNAQCVMSSGPEIR